MIRNDGYYIEEPIEIFDARSKDEKSTYNFNAYYFVNNDSLIISSKNQILTGLLDFQKEDFSSNLSIRKKVQIREDQIIMLKSFSFENEVIFKIINSNKIYNETFKKYMYFISWDNLKEKQTGKSEGTYIYNLFGPFYHKKFKVFFE